MGPCPLLRPWELRSSQSRYIGPSQGRCSEFSVTGKHKGAPGSTFLTGAGRKGGLIRPSWTPCTLLRPWELRSPPPLQHPCFLSMILSQCSHCYSYEDASLLKKKNSVKVLHSSRFPWELGSSRPPYKAPGPCLVLVYDLVTM